MKFNVGDSVSIEAENGRVEATIEDASKGDIVLAKVDDIKGRPPHYEIGKVYEFSRNDILDANNGTKR